ncbi:MAG: hypothetical protein AAFN70_03255, partial [Planctomycetota bacterium]
MADDSGADLSESYERRRNRNANRDREESQAGREIGPLPPVVNPQRRESCRLDLMRYLLTYRAESYRMEFGPDQKRMIAAVQDRVLEGGSIAIAMPRGSGKTTIILDATSWALGYSHRKFVVLLGAEKESAAELADDFRIVWETNEMLLQDFPEIAYPIHELKGVTQRAKAQLLNDEPTHMRWSGTKIVLPTVDGSAASGSVLRATGLLGRVRGMKSTTSSGETIRPDLVLVEDFQTDASAHSDLQCHKREKTIAQAVLGLAGPGQKIAAFATCTVIRKGDAADRILNQDIYPRWRGVRCKLVEQWPDESLREPKANEDPNLWQQYQTIRQDELAEGNESHPRATAFYRKHQVTMDAGASIRWPARKFAHEHSGIEHAINLRADNPDSFDAEYQNDPPGEDDATNSRFLDSDGFCMAIGPQLHRIVPDDTLAVTVGIDVHPSALYFATVAIREGFP